MSKRKVCTIVGARPQFVKAATVSRIFSERNDVIDEEIIHTGQHFDENMSESFFKEMEIPRPKFQLNINGGSHGAMTGQMLIEIERILLQSKPDCVLVYGDTNSTLSGALAACKLHIPVVHIEAGLRSYNMNMPEEINRIITDRISNILFCPTETAVKNLQDEGCKSKILNVGDVMYDAVTYYSNRISQQPIRNYPYVLCTLHRAENTNDLVRLENIILALNEINSTHKVVLPMHPRTRKVLSQTSIRPEFEIISPLSYFEMLNAIQNSICVMTDSGGVQKEAYFMDKFCITLRDETEWVELVEIGANFIVGANKDLIVSTFDAILDKRLQVKQHLYGDGNAAKKIVSQIIDYIN